MVAQPGDPGYDPTTQGVPVNLIDGASGLGTDLTTLDTDVKALKTSVDLLTTAVNALAALMAPH